MAVNASSVIWTCRSWRKSRSLFSICERSAAAWAPTVSPGVQIGGRLFAGLVDVLVGRVDVAGLRARVISVGRCEECILVRGETLQKLKVIAEDEDGIAAGRTVLEKCDQFVVSVVLVIGRRAQQVIKDDVERSGSLGSGRLEKVLGGKAGGGGAVDASWRCSSKEAICCSTPSSKMRKSA